MIDPVMTDDGHTYERKAILKWFTVHNKSPLTNEDLASTKVWSNHALRSAIDDFRAAHPSLQTNLTTTYPTNTRSHRGGHRGGDGGSGTGRSIVRGIVFTLQLGEIEGEDDSASDGLALTGDGKRRLTLHLTVPSVVAVLPGLLETALEALGYFGVPVTNIKASLRARKVRLNSFLHRFLNRF